MDRRKFLKTSLAAGVTGTTLLGASSCASVKFLEGSVPDEPAPDVDDVVARMDAGMARISAWNPLDDFLGPQAEGKDLTAANSVARNAIKSLYVTAMFSDLPVESQLHPRIQKRIKTALPEIGAAADQMRQHLENHCDVSDEQIQGCLNQDDEPGMRFLEQFNELAADNGITAQRRLQIRAMTTNILWRLKHQPPELLIQECNDKMERVAMSTGPDAAARRLVAARVTEEAFWTWQQQDDPNEDVSDYAKWSEENPSGVQTQKRKEEPPLSTRGARMMGIGMLMLGVGVGVAAGGVWPGVFLGTVGAVFFLIGLVKLLVGALGGDERAEPSEEIG
jgi:hypothetical protein